MHKTACFDNRNCSGFTLIELMVVSAIIITLTVFTIPAFTRFSSRQELRRAAEGLRTDIRTVQNRAVSGIDREVGGVPCYWWGMKLTEGESDYQFVRSYDEDYPEDDVEVVRKFSLAGKSEIFIPGGDSDLTIWYKMISGEVGGISGDKTIVVRKHGASCTSQDDSSAYCRDIVVSEGGKVK
ncbi:MAG: pilus assembly FimT family protein [Patescibacteria group bacterium]